MTPIKDAYINSWTALIALFGSVFAMWGLNLAGGQLLVIPFALVGFFVIGFVGFAPKQLAHSAILSGFAAFLSEGGLTRVNIGNELGKGLALHYRIVLVSAYSYTLAAFTLMTWSFANAPSAFWIIFLAVLLLLMAQQLHGTSSAWLPKVVSTYAVACILISLWSTFGGAYSGQAFDALSGEPAYMVDPITGTIDSLNRMPRDCRPTGTAHSNFNYGVDGTCFSAATGQRLVPITSDQALQRNPTSWGGMILKKAGVRSWWIIAGVGIIVALALIALGGPNHPKGGGFEANGAAPEKAEPLRVIPTNLRDGNDRHRATGEIPFISIAFFGLMALGGYVLVRELQSLPPPTKHPIQVAGAIPSAVKFDEDPSHYCHFIPPSSTINQENPNTWTDIDVPIGFRICMDPYDESQLKVQCRKFYTDQWSECNGEKAVSIRFKSNIPIVTWFEKIRPI